MLEMHPDFDRIVDDAFSRLQAGEEISRILARYPEDAERLLPLLEVAALCARAYAYTKPASPAGMARARNRYLSLARQRATRRTARRWRVLRPGRWAAAAVALVLALLVGTAAVAASASSVPGDLLYPVKTTVEGVRLAVARNPAERARLRMAWSQRRIGELEALLEQQGRFDERLVEAGQTEALAALQEIARLPDVERARLLGMYAAFAKAQARTLEQHLSEAPPPRQDILARAVSEYKNLAAQAEAARRQPESQAPPTAPTPSPSVTPTGTPTHRPRPTRRPTTARTPTATKGRPVAATAFQRPTRTPTKRTRATPTRTRRPPVSAVTVTRPVARPSATPAPTRTRPAAAATAVARPTTTPRPVRRRPTPTPTRPKVRPTRTPTSSIQATAQPTAVISVPPTRTPTPANPGDS